MAFDSAVTFAVGDIHGCLAKLRRLLRACEAHAGGRLARFVFLGDYIDRGPDSAAVVDLLMRLQATLPGAVVCLRGNHEQLAIDAHDNPNAVPLWLDNSGGITLESYRSSDGRIPEPHLAWLRALPLCHDDGLRFFVHAGVDLSVPLERQSPEVMLWIRESFFRRSDEVDCGRFVVHGHTPRLDGMPELCKHRVNLDTAAVIGGPLTAAAFDGSRAGPLGFLTDQGGADGWLAVVT